MISRKIHLCRFVGFDRPTFVFATACAMIAAFASPKFSAHAEDFAGVVARMQTDIAYLASDELAGRDVGTDGIAKAGEFIAKRFKDLGLETDKFDGGPYQEFAIPGPCGTR